MPNLIVQEGTVRFTGPFDVSTESGGQFSLSEAARSWTTLWSTMQAMGWQPYEAGLFGAIGLLSVLGARAVVERRRPV